MMGPKQVAQGSLFYGFSIEDHVRKTIWRPPITAISGDFGSSAGAAGALIS
jgi:hypothetical protein